MSTLEQRRRRRYERLMKEHGWKLQVPASCLSEEDKAPFGGGLRCFREVYPRDDFGNKIKHADKIRCKNVAKKGSLFCRKHGGANNHALVHGQSQTTTNALYRGAFKNDLGELFEAFISDPTIGDMKPELAALRTCASKWLQELTKGSKIKSFKKTNKELKQILMDDETGDQEKFMMVREIALSSLSITDGESMDRLVRVVETISRVIERMNKIQSRDEFILTPDGLKVLFRCIIDILKQNVSVETLKKVKEDMVTISVRTKGDLSQYSKDIGNNLKDSDIK